MSQRRLVWTGVVLVGVMTGAVAGTAMALPLGWPTTAAQPQQVVDGKDKGVTLPKVISEVKPKYTAEALRARIQGAVFMTTVIGTDGTPGDIKITKSLDTEHGLDKQATDALRQWRFQPGMKDGKPVPVRVEIEMRFTLKK
jgi:TonB family protein